MFPSHHGLSADINKAIQNSEIAGGAWIEKLPKGKGLKVRTHSRIYLIRKDENGFCTIQGHPNYCPTPVQCNIHGSTWGGSMIKVGFIGRDMRLEVGLPHGGVMTTSPIVEVEEIP